MATEVKSAKFPETGNPLETISGAWFLWVGAAALAIPTFANLAKEWWSVEQGGHGPLILVTGLWLFYRARDEIAAIARPGRPVIAIPLLVLSLLAYIFSRITSLLNVECAALYGIFLAVFYFHVGSAALKKMWFPLVYLTFMFPQPEAIIYPLSRVLKLYLSTAAVDLLSHCGFEIGQAGVVIYIDQYELLVAKACSGLHSLIGLSAICLFFCFVHYSGDWKKSAPLLIAIAPIALFANFLRVLILILVTHYFGDRIAQHYVHDFAAIVLFSTAVAMMVGCDILLNMLRARQERPS